MLNTALRPLTGVRIVLIAGMYLLLTAVLLVPISQQYHLFTLPSAELLAAAFVASLLGCGLVEVGHRGYVALVEKRYDDAR